jgi:hypothetical protein
MSDNLQVIPGGLIGLNETPQNVTYWDEATDYNVINTDQVIIIDNDVNVIFDPSIITPGKIFKIKNVSGDVILIDPGTSTIDGADDFTLNDLEVIELIYAQYKLTFRFHILSYYIPL